MEVFMSTDGPEPDSYQLTEEALLQERKYLAAEVTKDPDRIPPAKLEALVRVHLAIDALHAVRKSGGPEERPEPSYQMIAT